MTAARWLFCILLSLSAQLVAAPAPEGLEAGLVNPGFHEQPSWFKNSFLDIREDVAEAGDSGKRVMLYFYQDGCPYCQKLLEVNLGIAAISDKLRSEFDVIAINMWGDREVTDAQGNQITEKRFAENLRVMFTPTLLFLNEQGRVVLRLNGYYPPHRFEAALDYVSGQRETKERFRSYVERVAPRPSSGKFHNENTFLDAASGLFRPRATRPLLVLFEQKDCAPCDELHLDTMQRPETRELMKQFDIGLVDMWSRGQIRRPDGRRSTARQWARDLDIKYAPSLVFFDPAGKEIFRTEAWLKAFHIQSVMDYVASGAWQTEPNFQRFISRRADELEAKGIHVDLMD